MDKFNDWAIQPRDRRINVKVSIDLILDFNETTQLDLVQKYKNQKMSD